VQVDLMAGATISIAAGKVHAIQALGADLRCIEVCIGNARVDEVIADNA
jgi:mannose-1-phosphate guanylyltransferase